MSQDLFLELQEKIKLLDSALGLLGKRGRDHAQAEHDYRVALAERMIREKEAGKPATILSDICRGASDIALLKFQRDCMEVSYKSALEALNVYKIQVKVLNEQLDREYNRR
jgi:hypothetical protein